jgi:uncharacterized RDD family membrane protein YckC
MTKNPYEAPRAYLSDAGENQLSEPERPELNQVVACGLCQQPAPRRQMVFIHGQVSCIGCRDSFVYRRLFAFTIDVVLWILLIPFPSFLYTSAYYIPASEFERQLMNNFSPLLLPITFCIKDGCFGYSPGKFLFSLRVLRVDTGRPIGLGRSLGRNLIFAVPCLSFLFALLIGFEIMTGTTRFGDGLAGTIVVWQRYATRPAFRIPQSLP